MCLTFPIINNEISSGSLVDAGLYLFHNISRTLNKGTGPYFYLPKIENHLEARLWNEIFSYATLLHSETGNSFSSALTHKLSK